MQKTLGQAAESPELSSGKIDYPGNNPAQTATHTRNLRAVIPLPHGLGLPGSARSNARFKWRLGDWWAYGSHAYGERVQALDAGLIGDLEFSTVAHYGAVARAFESGRRGPLVSFSHHREVAGIKDPALQDQWLDRAEADGLWQLTD
jgi:hypothetical protein